MQAVTQKWMNWIAGIAAQNKLAHRGNAVEKAGKVVKKLRKSIAQKVLTSTGCTILYETSCKCHLKY